MPNRDPLILARGLVKRFGEMTAVDGIDVEVRAGESFGFLGPNGAGKSSTMRMIGCVSAPSGGVLSILGMDPVREGPAIRARLGVCPQQDSLDPELTVEENLIVYARYFGISRQVARQRAADLIDFVQLEDVARLRKIPLAVALPHSGDPAIESFEQREPSRRRCIRVAGLRRRRGSIDRSAQ